MVTPKPGECNSNLHSADFLLLTLGSKVFSEVWLFHNVIYESTRETCVEQFKKMIFWAVQRADNYFQMVQGTRYGISSVEIEGTQRWSENSQGLTEKSVLDLGVNSESGVLNPLGCCQLECLQAGQRVGLCMMWEIWHFQEGLGFILTRCRQIQHFWLHWASTNPQLW